MYSALTTTDTNINFNDLDKLTLRNTVRVTLTKESTSKFLQNFKLLPLTSKADNDCDQNRPHNWCLSKLDRQTDGKCEHLDLSHISYFTFRCHECSYRKSICTGAFFEHSHLPLVETVESKIFRPEPGSGPGLLGIFRSRIRLIKV